MPDGGELVGIEDQCIRFDRQVAGAIDDDVEGEVAIIATFRVGDLLRQGRYQPIALQTPAARSRSDAGGRARDLAELILLDAIAAIVWVSLVGRPGIAQVRRLDSGSRRYDGYGGKRQLLGLLRTGAGRQRYDRHRGDNARQSRRAAHKRFASCSQIVSPTIWAHPEYIE